ncbi:MAG: hypothetical protein WCK46_01250 [Candidatus Adlerbacteria bacterium]
MKGTEFLKKKYNLHNTPEVKAAASRTDKRTGEKVPQKPDAQIQNYLDRFTGVLARTDPKKRERGLEAFKDVLHKKLVIRGEDVPENYFVLQQRIARERGHGTVAITPAERAHHVEVIRRDQMHSLDRWVTYLASNDAQYEDWFKYYILRGASELSEYDAEKKDFGKRSKGTTKPFPEINSEAVTYIYDAVLANGDKNPGEVVAPVDIQLKEAARNGDFAKIYAAAIEKAAANSAELFPETKGEWVKFDKGSDHTPLVKSLQNRGTGWCTAGFATAQTQLQGGDFYVYYSLDTKGEPTIPRVAIRMEGTRIAEVRGVAPQQNLDQYITPVVKQKLQGFPDGQLYEKKVADMAELTTIAKKEHSKQPLTKEELSFLYERNSKIEGFGQNRDPRIGEIRNKRNRDTDLMTIYGVDAAHTAVHADEIREGIILFTGDMYINKDTQFPDSLKYVAGDFQIIFDAADIPESLALKLLKLQRSDMVVAQLEKFEPLSAAAARALCEAGHTKQIADKAERFIELDTDTALALIDSSFQGFQVKEIISKVPEADHEKIATHMLEKKWYQSVVGNLEKFSNTDNQKVADALIAAGEEWTLANFLNKFTNLNAATAKKLIEGSTAQQAEFVAENLAHFGQLDKETAFALVTHTVGDRRSWFCGNVLEHLNKFEPLDHMELARTITKIGQGHYLIPYLFKLKNVDHQEVAKLLIEGGDARSVARDLHEFGAVNQKEVAREILKSKEPGELAYHLENFTGLDAHIAEELHDLNADSYILNNMKSFEPKEHAKIALMLMRDEKKIRDVAWQIDQFDSLNTEAAEKIIGAGYSSIVADNLGKFGNLSRTVDRELVRMEDMTRGMYFSRIGKRVLRTLGAEVSLGLPSKPKQPRERRSPPRNNTHI